MANKGTNREADHGTSSKSTGEVESEQCSSHRDFVRFQRFFDDGSEHQKRRDVSVGEREEEHEQHEACVSISKSVQLSTSDASEEQKSKRTNIGIDGRNPFDGTCRSRLNVAHQEQWLQ